MALESGKINDFLTGKAQTLPQLMTGRLLGATFRYLKIDTKKLLWLLTLFLPMSLFGHHGFKTD